MENNIFIFIYLLVLLRAHWGQSKRKSYPFGREIYTSSQGGSTTYTTKNTIPVGVFQKLPLIGSKSGMMVRYSQRNALLQNRTKSPINF